MGSWEEEKPLKSGSLIDTMCNIRRPRQKGFLLLLAAAIFYALSSWLEPSQAPDSGEYEIYRGPHNLRNGSPFGHIATPHRLIKDIDVEEDLDDGLPAIDSDQKQLHHDDALDDGPPPDAHERPSKAKLEDMMKNIDFRHNGEGGGGNSDEEDDDDFGKSINEEGEIDLRDLTEWDKDVQNQPYVHPRPPPPPEVVEDEEQGKDVNPDLNIKDDKPPMLGDVLDDFMAEKDAKTEMSNRHLKGEDFGAPVAMNRNSNAGERADTVPPNGYDIWEMAKTAFGQSLKVRSDGLDCTLEPAFDSPCGANDARVLVEAGPGVTICVNGKTLIDHDISQPGLNILVLTKDGIVEDAKAFEVTKPYEDLLSYITAIPNGLAVVVGKQNHAGRYIPPEWTAALASIGCWKVDGVKDVTPWAILGIKGQIVPTLYESLQPVSREKGAPPPEPATLSACIPKVDRIRQQAAVDLCVNQQGRTRFCGALGLSPTVTSRISAATYFKVVTSVSNLPAALPRDNTQKAFAATELPIAIIAGDRANYLLRHLKSLFAQPVYVVSAQHFSSSTRYFFH